MEMEDSENRGQELEVDGQFSHSGNLDDAKPEQQQEDTSPAAVTEDQNPDKTRSEDKNMVPELLNPNENGADGQKHGDAKQVPVELPVKEACPTEKEGLVNVPAEHEHDTTTATAVAQGNAGRKEVPESEDAGPDTHPANLHELVTPNSLVKFPRLKAKDDSGLNESKLPPAKSTIGKRQKEIEEDDESGTPEDQAAFMKELESFYRERAMDFKPPRFYGQPLNCLKLWRAVAKLGGYDLVTGSKIWRLVGESFHPPKTCTSVSWTFRVFYEKALLEYERYKTESGELQLSVAVNSEPSSVENEANGYQAPGSGRVRRDAAARAMQGWHAQRLFGDGEIGEPIIKDKTFNSMPKREKSLKSIVKHKRPTDVEHSVKAQRTETAKQLRL